MGKNLTPKVVLIIVLIVVAAWTLYPPQKTLKPGIDLAGGTSLIYEIDTTGLKPQDQKNLAEKMITVLRRRIDPANIQNLVWRPLGNTRFEIQMPLASAEARQKRQEYERALRDLLEANISRSRILLSLKKPPEERARDFEKYAQGSQERLRILNNLAQIHDEREEARRKRSELADRMKTLENAISSAGLDLRRVRLNVGQWIVLGEEELNKKLSGLTTDPNKSEPVRDYVKLYRQWAEVENKLTDPETGLNAKYDEALKELDKLNLTEDQIMYVLEMRKGSARRKEALAKLKSEFPDRAEKIDKLVKAYEKYRPFRGRLDDPKDLQRMLKGAGILEFRILPTTTDGKLDADQIARYVERLKSKGPKYASDENYIWCEIENIDEWKVPNSIVASFGDKYYVLASNRPDEVMLHTGGQRRWKLEQARASQDRMGRRAIAFRLDERGGRMFRKLTRKNLNRPLCILLDGIAISAPRIEAEIGRDGIITGTFSRTEVEDMVNKLNAGSLPARLIEQPIMVKSIGPSIGADNRDQGIKAGLIGLAAVIFCMAVYYTLAGAIADAALLLNLLFVLAMMALLRATFTLPGIAGIILTIGMSVDANVLIFERIREEQLRGASLTVAIRNGYQRAFRAIFDANLTTFITAAILYWRASEEVKGFAIVLMLGIISSMFTALFVTRVVFDFLLSRRIIKNPLFMLRLIHEPKIDWMRARPVFLTLSGLLIMSGLLIFFTRDDTKNSKYDIEFTGGTSVQIDLKEGVELTRREVEQRIHKVGEELGNPALQAASVYSIGKPIKVLPDGRKVYKQYEITTTETNKTVTTVKFTDSAVPTVDSFIAAIEKAQRGLRSRLTKLVVVRDKQDSSVFRVATSQLNPSLVESVLQKAFPQAQIGKPELKEVVNDAILRAFEGMLDIKANLRPQIISAQRITEDLIEQHPQLADFLGGVKLECTLGKAATLQQIQSRLAALRFKPDMRDLNWAYEYKLLNPQFEPPSPNQPLQSFIYVSVSPEAGLRQLSEEEWSKFAANEERKILSACQLETSLPRVTQIDPSVGAEAKTRALIAIILSLFAIVAYIWIRFGNVRYGFGAIVALVHDVCITLGAVTACTYIAATNIGQYLLIGDFKIDLAMIAAFLTLIGYSLNDTIVVFDRIRENKKKGNITPSIINSSINQTMSRTLLTSFTTFIVVLIMYIFGGNGLRGFTFAIGFGVIVGTYSSIAIAAPLLLLGKGTSQSGK